MAGLYLHVPFRARPCLYDDTSTVLAEPPYPSYVQALTTELHDLARLYGSAEPIETLYLGGGRPSLLQLHELRTIWNVVHEVFQANRLVEATLEVHPADLTSGYLHGVQDIGIDRISLDIMSFYEEDLRSLDADQPSLCREEALVTILDAGFDSVVAELYFGWAEQPEMHWEASLQKAVRLGVPHLSITECTGDQLAEASEARRAHQFEFAMTYLPEHGYEHYEISNFARPGHRGYHNQQHWNHSNYLGCGPGAHSFWWSSEAAVRWSNVRNLARYEALVNQRHRPLAQKLPLSREELATEYVGLRLRTADGIDLDRCAERYGFDLRTEHSETLAQLISDGYIELRDERYVSLTRRGMLAADAITRTLLPD